MAGVTKIDAGDLTAFITRYIAHLEANGSESGKAFLEQEVGAEVAAELAKLSGAVRIAQRDLVESGIGPRPWLAQELENAGVLQAVEQRAHDDLAVESPEQLADALTTASSSATLDALRTTPLAEAGPTARVTLTFMDDELGSEGESDFARVVAAGAIHGATSRGETLRPEHVLPAAEMGVASAKAAYQVAKGDVSAEVAGGYLEEKAAAIVGAVCRTYAPRLAEKGGALLGAVIGGFLGNPALGAQLGAQAGRFIGTRFRDELAQAAEKITRAAFQKARQLGAKIVNSLMDIFA